MSTRMRSPFGAISIGEQYLIYNFIIFWDSFEHGVSTQASGEGIYSRARDIPEIMLQECCSVRTITLLPPGSSFTDTIQAILEDALQMWTAPFYVTYVEEVKRRRFTTLKVVLQIHQL